MVVESPGQVKVGNLATRDGQPVYMAGVRGTQDCLVPGVMDLVELRGADTDVQPIVEPGKVGSLAGGAEILQVLCLVLHILQDPVLP